MPSIDFVVQTDLSRSTRVKQLEAMFDVPPETKVTLRWRGELPIEGQEWNVGLIVGPSGSGKSTIAQRIFGDHVALTWDGKSVIDDFARELSMQAISEVCQAVGFNTIPAWMRPYSVLSNGERFRVDLARRLLELPDPVVVDEFTSVVDRQVARIGAHAVQKFIRRNKRQFVAVTCHYDVIDWLQPDWIFEPATMSFTGRSVQRRPSIDVEIARVPYAAWRIFAPFHYLTAELNKAAQCFVLSVDGQPASFAGMRHQVHPQVHDIQACSRLVTLPDWQGMGFAMILIDKVSEAYKAIGKRVHTYPAHPSLIRSFGKSAHWRMTKKPGTYSAMSKGTSKTVKPGDYGGRPCAVFEYTGPSMDVATARQLLGK